MRSVLRVLVLFNVLCIAFVLRAAEIVEAEYFIGEDPGEGNGTLIELGGEDVLSVEISELSVTVSGLESGVYDLGLRVKDGDGLWSNAVIRRFNYFGNEVIGKTLIAINNPESLRGTSQEWHISIPTQNDRAAYSIRIGVKEFFFHREPGQSKSDFLQLMRFNLESDLYVATRFDIDILDDNLIALRYFEEGLLDNLLVSSSDFNVEVATIGKLSLTDQRITDAEYFIDLDPGEGEGNPIEVDSGVRFGVSFDELEIPIWKYKAGNHRIGIRFMNAAGQWGEPIYRAMTSYSIFGDNDVNAPVINLSQNAVSEWPLGVKFEDTPVIATDPEDGDLSDRVVVERGLDETLEGDQVIRYIVADYAGNFASLERTISVRVNRSPLITNQSFTLIEGSVDLASVLASDLDGDTLSYGFDQEVNGFLFDGAVLQAANSSVLDYEKNEIIKLNVNVSDGEFVSSAVVTINLTDDREEDADGDGLTEAQEEDIYGTSDTNLNSDGDGYSDAEEVASGTDPADPNDFPALLPHLKIDSVYGPSGEIFALLIEFNASIGSVYTIEYSTDLVSWVPASAKIQGDGDAVRKVFIIEGKGGYYRVQKERKVP